MKKRNPRGRAFRRHVLRAVLWAALLAVVLLLILGTVRIVRRITRPSEQTGTEAAGLADSADRSALVTGAEGSTAETAVPGAGSTAQAAVSEPAETDLQTGATAAAASAEDAGLQPAPSAEVKPAEGSAAAESGGGGGTMSGEVPYDHTATELETGREYLESLEKRTPMEMEVLIDEARALYEEKREQLAYLKKRNEYREMLSGDAVWENFRDYVFLGDSRVVGFSTFQFLPEDRVLARPGDTIDAIEEQTDMIRDLSPKYVFLSYGINDIGIGYWPTAEEYADALAERIEALQKAVPDAEIYVNSILPATDEAVAYGPAWAGLPEYSEAVRQMCAQKEIPFIDNTLLVEEHGDLYAEDGIHLQPEFYRYWAENQLLALYDRKHGKLTFPENGAMK